MMARIIRKIATSNSLEQDYQDVPLDEREEAPGAQPSTVLERRNNAGHTRLTDRPEPRT